MSAPKRSKDGRFVPRTGDAVLPPKKQQPRDEHGHFIPQEKVVSSKPYSRAVRELLDAPEGSIPEGWVKEKLTEAQGLAMVHMSMARAGNVQIGMVIIDRAEGKVPQAAEDREAAVKSGMGAKLLADLLGIKLLPIVDTDIVPQPDPGSEQSPKEDTCTEPRLLASGSPESDSPSSSPTSSEDSSSPLQESPSRD